MNFKTISVTADVCDSCDQVALASLVAQFRAIAAQLYEANYFVDCVDVSYGTVRSVLNYPSKDYPKEVENNE